MDNAMKLLHGSCLQPCMLDLLITPEKHNFIVTILELPDYQTFNLRSDLYRGNVIF